MKVMYSFWGGEYDGKLMTREEVDKISTGEMCGEHPRVKDYIYPRVGNIYHEVNGKLKDSAFCTEEERQSEEIRVVTYFDPKEAEDIFD